jgi:hypothetical protein
MVLVGSNAVEDPREQTLGHRNTLLNILLFRVISAPGEVEVGDSSNCIGPPLQGTFVPCLGCLLLQVLERLHHSVLDQARFTIPCDVPVQTRPGPY